MDFALTSNIIHIPNRFNLIFGFFRKWQLLFHFFHEFFKGLFFWLHILGFFFEESRLLKLFIVGDWRGGNRRGILVIVEKTGILVNFIRGCKAVPNGCSGHANISAFDDSNHDFVRYIFWKIDSLLGHGHIWVLNFAEYHNWVFSVFVFSEFNDFLHTGSSCLEGITWSGASVNVLIGWAGFLWFDFGFGQIDWHSELVLHFDELFGRIWEGSRISCDGFERILLLAFVFDTFEHGFALFVASPCDDRQFVTFLQWAWWQWA